ncbi:MAG: single-stranded DNA-binding protein [Chloroflexota bacterium]
MAGMQRLIIIGNLGRDPEMRYLPSGSAVTNFSVAVSRRWNDRDGQQREETEWFNVDAFEKQAEIANQYLSKGKQVCVEGRVHLDTWDDRQSGEKRASLKVRAQQITLLGTRQDSESEDMGSSGGSSFSGPSSTSEIDNIPF